MTWPERSDVSSFRRAPLAYRSRAAAARHDVGDEDEGRTRVNGGNLLNSQVACVSESDGLDPMSHSNLRYQSKVLSSFCAGLAGPGQRLETETPWMSEIFEDLGRKRRRARSQPT
jgi:hypothetical protein